MVICVNLFPLFGYIKKSIVMFSPSQRRGSCDHMMAGFNSHKKCGQCRDKGIGDDPCVKQEVCEICECFTDTQHAMLSTPRTRYVERRKQVSWCHLPRLQLLDR